MKILKPGTLVDDACFTCKICGCEFEANRTEYVVNRYPRDEYPAVIHCNCPTCGTICSATKIKRSDIYE